ncbi:MAG: hypothetical protein ACOZF0_04045 [Thermodesulfobacteriota bacterium]
MTLPKRILKKIKQIIVAVTLVSLGAAADGHAAATNLDAGSMVADTLIARPLGLAALVFGSAMFVVSLPFSAPGGNISLAAEKMVVNPAKFTFARPLGKKTDAGRSTDSILSDNEL